MSCRIEDLVSAGLASVDVQGNIRIGSDPTPINAMVHAGGGQFSSNSHLQQTQGQRQSQSVSDPAGEVKAILKGMGVTDPDSAIASLIKEHGQSRVDDALAMIQAGNGHSKMLDLLTETMNRYSHVRDEELAALEAEIKAELGDDLDDY